MICDLGTSSSSPSSTTITIVAPLAFISCMFDRVLVRTWVSVATPTTTTPFSMRAIGPCFISPAA
jgi:hypothetical protein